LIIIGLALWLFAGLAARRPPTIHIHFSGDLRVTHVHGNGRHLGDVIDGEYHRLR
jgi:hypothetical protein